jgi:hypothetical protein
MSGDTERDEAPDRPLGGYGLFIGTYLGATAGFAAWLARSGRAVPDEVRAGDLALVAVATHKSARLVSKDRVTSVLRVPFTAQRADGPPGEVEESARGRGLRRAIGEAIICPYCLALWIATGFTMGILVAPKPTRWVAFTLSAVAGSDFLQVAYRHAQDAG